MNFEKEKYETRIDGHTNWCYDYELPFNIEEEEKHNPDFEYRLSYHGELDVSFDRGGSYQTYHGDDWSEFDSAFLTGKVLNEREWNGTEWVENEGSKSDDSNPTPIVDSNQIKKENDTKGYFKTKLSMTLEFLMEYELPYSLEEFKNDPDIKVDIDRDWGIIFIEYPDGTESYHYPTFRPHFDDWNEKWEVKDEDFVSPEESSNV
jgi:hypothetical protein